MSIEKVKRYKFNCDTMRYTDSTQKFVELCDGSEVFEATSCVGAECDAKRAGWTISRQAWGDQDTCRFYAHSQP